MLSKARNVFALIAVFSAAFLGTLNYPHTAFAAAMPAFVAESRIALQGAADQVAGLTRSAPPLQHGIPTYTFGPQNTAPSTLQLAAAGDSAASFSTYLTSLWHSLTSGNEVTATNPDPGSLYAPRLASAISTPRTIAATPPSVVQQTIINQPVIHSTGSGQVERIVTAQAAPGVSQSSLSAQLQSLKDDLLNRIAGIAAPAYSPQPAPATFQALALTQRIDQLNGTKLTNVTVNGVSGLTAADIPHDIIASNYLPLIGGALTGDLTISGALSAGSLLVSAISSSGAIQAPYFTATSTSAASTFPNFTATNGSIASLITTSATTTNATSTNLYSSSLVAGSATSTSFFATLGHFTTGVVDTLTATVATISSLTASNLTATNATTTNATSTNAYVGHLALGAPLVPASGGTGISSSPAFGQLLVGQTNGTYALTATSSLGLLASTSIVASLPLAWNSATGALTISQAGIGVNGYLTSADWNLFNGKVSSTSLSGGAGISYNAATGVISNTGVLTTLGDWAGTLSGQTGAYYFSNSFSTTSANYYLGQNQGAAFSTTSATYFAAASTTVPKTYSTNTFTGSNVFNGALTIGSLNGLLYGTNGSVGTISTSTLGLLSSSSISAIAPLSYAAATGIFSITQSSTGVNGYLSGTDYTTFNNKISSTSLSGGTGITYNSATGVIGSAIGYLFPSNATNTLLAFNGGLTTTNASTSAISGNTAAFGGTATTSIAANGALTIQSLTGFLKATAGLVSTSLINLASDMTGILPVGNGGTGWSNFQANSLLLGNGTGAIATTTAGTNGQVLALLAGVPTWVATTTLATISGVLSGAQLDGVFGSNGILARTTTGTYASRTFTGTAGQISVANGDGIAGNPTLSIPSQLTLTNASSSALSANTASFGQTGTTSVAANGALTIQSLTGFLKATAGLVATSLINLASDVTGVLPVTNGGTGWAAIQAGTIPYGNGTGAVATSSALTFDGTKLIATYASTTALTSSGSAYFATSGGNVGIGTTTPNNKVVISNSGTSAFTHSGYGLAIQTANFGEVIQSDANDTTGVLRVLGNAGATEALRVQGNGNVGIGTTVPGGKLEILQDSGGTTPAIRITGSAGDPTNYHLDIIALTGPEGGVSYKFQVKNIGTVTTPFYVNGVNGNVGIGITTPTTALMVNGTIAMNGIPANPSGQTLCYAGNSGTSGYVTIGTCSSDERLKNTILPIATSSDEMLQAVLNLKPVTFKWNGDATTTYAGFIAQDVLQQIPLAVRTQPDGHYSLDTTAITSYLAGAIQDIATLSGTFRNTLVAWLGDANNGIHDVYATVFHSKEVDTEQLCVADDAGKTCITRAQLDSVLAHPSTTSSPPPASDVNASTTPVDSTPPVISVNGDNPARIHVGDAYADLGATIVSPDADKNLGIETFLNGALISDIVLDTSSAATDTIDYVATDTLGNTATSTRTVIVGIVATSTAATDVSSSGSSATSTASN